MIDNRKGDEVVKLRLLPVVVTILVSTCVLFGGWFAYQSYAMEEPFQQQLSAIDGVESSEVTLARETAIVRVALLNDANLRLVHQAIEEAGAQSLGNRRIAVEFETPESATIENWWSKALFDVAQAMETKTYAMIPAKLSERSETDAGVTAETEMDDMNVYITLRSGEDVKYIVLPRAPAMMGVWPNE